MTLPPIIRIFFAIDLSPAMKQEIGQYIAELKRKGKTNHIRWTKSEQLHITLQFLPQIKTEHLPLLVKNVKEAVRNWHASFVVKLGKLQFFPNAYRPRILALEVEVQSQLSSLSSLSSLIGDGITATGYAKENREFKAHLTIGRIKHAQAVKLNFISETCQPFFQPIPVTEFALFQSEPQPDGSHYVLLEKISLL